ncbi:MAG TPA: GtrA family protein [Patescibacteria group bacterium]|nr:GtrA family protein [Patescibacteria group bacterium]
MIEKILAYVIKKYLFRFPSLVQFIKFSLVGALNTLVDLFVYLALTRLLAWFGENYLVANAVSFSLAVTNSFFINRKWTFRDEDKKKLGKKYLKFFVSSLVALAAVELAMYLLVGVLGVYDVYAKFMVVVVSVGFSFSLSKLWVFRK